MLKANELRIGNWVLYSSEDGGYVRVSEIMEMDRRRVGNMSIGYRGVKGGYHTTSLEESQKHEEPSEYLIQPIPITEEILLKCGFVYHWDDDYENHVFSLVREQKDDVIIEPTFNIQNQCEIFYLVHFDFQMELELKNFHQLQNLYFALTGEELNVNL